MIAWLLSKEDQKELADLHHAVYFGPVSKWQFQRWVQLQRKAAIRTLLLSGSLSLILSLAAIYAIHSLGH